MKKNIKKIQNVAVPVAMLVQIMIKQEDAIHFV